MKGKFLSTWLPPKFLDEKLDQIAVLQEGAGALQIE
jgi:hypothetical protein